MTLFYERESDGKLQTYQPLLSLKSSKLRTWARIAKKLFREHLVTGACKQPPNMPSRKEGRDRPRGYMQAYVEINCEVVDLIWGKMSFALISL